MGLEDRGDIVCVHWTYHPEVSIRVEVGKTAGEVEDKLRAFLEARPTADLCIDCKTLAEIKEKQIGG